MCSVHAKTPNSAYAAAVPIFIDRARKNQPITIFGDGEQTRDFIYVKDIVAANAFLATTPEHTGVYNVAYGGKTSIKDLAERIIELTGSSSQIEHAPERSGDIKHSTASNERLLSAGWTPSYNFNEGLKATLESI